MEEMTINTLKSLVKQKGTLFYVRLKVEGGTCSSKITKAEVKAFIKQYKDPFTWIKAEVDGHRIFILRDKLEK